MDTPQPIVRRLLAAACLLWVTAGWLAPAVQAFMMHALPSVRQWELAGVLALLAIGASRVEFSIGRNETTISPFAQPLVLAALFLPPWLAAGLSLAVCVVIDGRRDPWRMTLFNAASLALPALLASMAAQWLSGGHVAGAALLPCAIIGATLFELGNAFGFGMYLEHRYPDSLRDFVGQVPAVIGIQILLDVLLAVMVIAYLHWIALAVVVFVAFQAITYAGLALANSEQVQRRRGDFLQDTFSRYVPSSVVSELVGNDMHIELGGQQREITVLFCDIRGFTSWSENREAQEIITELNSLLSELSAAVIEHEGTLDKFTGDGLMAFWGAPLPTDDHASRACAAALEMISRLEALNHERVRAGQEPFAIGVGVHSGPAVVGNVGHEQRLDYTAIGDTVNLAARLEAATKEIGSVLLVSSATQERLPTGLRTRSMRIGEISVKGRRQPVEVYALQPRRPGLEDIADPDDAGVAPSTFTSFLQDEPDSDTRLLDDDSAMAA